MMFIQNCTAGVELPTTPANPTARSDPAGATRGRCKGKSSVPTPSAGSAGSARTTGWRGGDDYFLARRKSRNRQCCAAAPVAVGGGNCGAVWAERATQGQPKPLRARRAGDARAAEATPCAPARGTPNNSRALPVQAAAAGTARYQYVGAHRRTSKIPKPSPSMALARMCRNDNKERKSEDSGAHTRQAATPEVRTSSHRGRTANAAVGKARVWQ